VAPGRGKCRRSDAVIEFIEKLKIPSGVGQGQPMKLRSWQKDLIRCTFDPEDDRGRRRIRTAIWSMARKNAKTALAAALVLVFLVGPEARLNGEVLSAASDKDQAAIIYKMVRQMVELDDELSQMCKCVDTQKIIVCYHLGSQYKALTADARRQHGGNPLFCIYDELAQAPNRELYDVLSTAFGAQEEGLLLAISTQSSDPNSIMSELADDALQQMRGLLVDPQFFGWVFALPEDPDDETFGPVPGIVVVDGKRQVDIYDERNWYLANPALGDFKVLADMQARAAKARRTAAAEAAFCNLHLNQRVDGQHAFIKSSDWRACLETISDDLLRAAPMHLGLDLSSRQDLTAGVGAFDLPLIVPVKAWFWTPADTLQERAGTDKAPYLLWAEQKHLRDIPGKSVSFAVVAKDVLKLAETYNLVQLTFDRWRIHDFKRELERAGAVIEQDKEDPKVEWVRWAGRRFKLVPHGQGYKDMAPAIDNLEELAVTHKLRHDGNPVLTYCMSNVKLTRDDAGNRKFDKKRETRRIDGAVALAMAVSGLNRLEPEAPQTPSVYEQRGVIAF
jgi:phage terminase large subunit-like protein